MRNMTPLQRALAAFTAIAGATATGCGAQEHSFDGTYSVTFAGSALTLMLRTLESGTVAGTIHGGGAVLELNGRVETDDEGDVSVTGTLTGPGGRSDFTLYPEEDGTFGLMLTPYDAAGTPRIDQTSVYAVARTSDEVPVDLAQRSDASASAAAPADHPAGTPPGAVATGAAVQSGGSRDERLVGIWSMQVIMNSEVGSVATELRMQFSSDGIMRDISSRALGDVGGGIIETGGSGGADEAHWRTEGDMIWISYAGSPWVPFARFQVNGTQLLLMYPHDGSRQLWHRASAS